MSTPIMRGGKLLSNPFAGTEYDLKRLSYEQAQGVSELVDKARAGRSININDLETIVSAREAARINEPPVDQIETLSRLIGDLKGVFK